MKTFIQIIALGLIMVFSVSTANAAKENNDRKKAPVTKAADEIKKAKQKAKHGGGEHEVSWGTNARAVKGKGKGKGKAIDHNASRSNTTASKTQPNSGPKGDKNAKKNKEK